jgi:hypothetical protein
MNNAFEPLEMYQLSRNEVINTLSNNHKKHHTISVAKFKIMSDLVWSKESGKKDLDTYQTIAKQR